MTLNLRKLFTAPKLSVIIPTYNRVEELRLCLEGFAQQTAPLDCFEIVVVDDGSDADIQSVVAPFKRTLRIEFIRTANAGPGAARNTAMERASSPLLLLYDDDLRPFPDLVARCLDFHSKHPQDEHASLLYFRPDIALADCPALHWGFRFLYPFPAETGVFDWRLFWSGTLTCKKRLFDDLRFKADFRALEDSELALRLSRRFNMRIHFDGCARGTMTRRMSFHDLYKRQYASGYFRYRLALAHPGKLHFNVPPFDEPEKYVISNASELKVLLAMAKQLEAKAIREESEASPQLEGLWNRAEVHARVSGWIAARDGMPAPGLA